MLSTNAMRRIKIILVCSLLLTVSACGQEDGEKTTPIKSEETMEVRTSGTVFSYTNDLVRIEQPVVLFEDHPEYVAPLEQETAFRAPMLLHDEDADLRVDAWRYSYNARGIVMVQNAIKAENTAIIIVHPWGVDDDNGYLTPEPHGAALFCTPEKNRIYLDHLRDVVMPFIDSLRDRVKYVGYSLPGHEDEIRKHMYRSIEHDTVNPELGQNKFDEVLELKSQPGGQLPRNFSLTAGRALLRQYFSHFPGLDASFHYNGPFWEVPMPLSSYVTLHENEFVIYDADGYEKVRDFLLAEGITNILLGGYATDMCVVSTTAGYMNFRNDFNVFIVGDATLATFPAQDTPAYATSAALALASLDNFITQISWIEFIE